MSRYDSLPILALLMMIRFTISLGSKIPIIFDSSNIWHRSIQYHPEQPARIQACVKKLQHISGIQLIDVTPAPSTQTYVDNVRRIPFSEEQLNYARQILLKTHDPKLIQNLETRCRESRRRRVEEGRNPLGFVGNIDDDTYATTESFDVCLRATASWIQVIDSVMDHNDNDENKDPSQSVTAAAMALTRPPGHHATYDMSNGFCLVNFAAAAAIHAMEKDQDLKISIFDWDVHYGQGVADILGKYERSRYVSIHQTPAFPYMGGKFAITGVHKNIMTVPIIADMTWSLGYSEKFRKHVLPFLISTEWQPDLVLICAGFDALDSDELASVSLVARDYGEMIGELKRHLKTESPHRKVPIALGLEGGYQLSEMAGGGNLADAVESTIRALLMEDDEGTDTADDVVPDVSSSEL